jgi:cytolysin-activating lysine-acyltransferase
VAAQAKLQQTFGKIALALLTVLRYRYLAISDLQYLVLDLLFRDRIALAQPTNAAGVVDERDMVGFAIWANVSEEVDAKIREQITAGVIPVRLKPEDWASGPINWLLDVVAPAAMLATAVLANLRQVICVFIRVHLQMLDKSARKIQANPDTSNVGTEQLEFKLTHYRTPV